ncbi:uncharacterized protein LOC124162567 isoform X2 [Ischnura elegans]|nr:uncharacterized protein LOC124162567 isoform X2 [Ischnura elegans]XP_046395101.1 uncharacterized protein LOC124162567 isoform X2 [Ischnura elegans]XP_046395102.1 uncharacterized protein LOC124162567 isoform X2 [Ischnura elegans]
MGQNGTENPASPSSMGEVYSTVTIKREVEYPVGGAEEMGQPSSSSSSIYVASPMASPLNSDCMPPPSSPLSPPAIACELTAPPPDSHVTKDTAPRISVQPLERVMLKDSFAPDASSPGRRTTYIRDAGGEALAQFLAYSYSQIKSHEIKINLKHIWLKALMDAELKDLSYDSPR